jgi:hypothetical protein
LNNNKKEKGDLKAQSFQSKKVVFQETKKKPYIFIEGCFLARRAQERRPQSIIF